MINIHVNVKPIIERAVMIVKNAKKVGGSM